MIHGLEILMNESHEDFDDYFDGYFCGRIENDIDRIKGYIEELKK